MELKIVPRNKQRVNHYTWMTFGLPVRSFCTDPCPGNILNNYSTLKLLKRIAHNVSFVLLTVF